MQRVTITSRIPSRLKGLVARAPSLQAPGPPAYSACYAPSTQLYFQPDGQVRACCMNMRYPLGNVATDRIGDIWNGARRRILQERLAVDDYSHGCQGCAWEVEVAGYEGSYPARFVGKASHLTDDPASGAWPRWIEFNLSNSCNLQCIQCNGDLSSSIRIHREKRLPAPKVYGDEFFEDIVPFLSHLDDAQFAGGEPFLGAENFRMWDLIAEVAPHVRCSVVTNATQWNKRVERVLDTIDMGFVFSIDGITKDTYEAIRIDSDFDEVITNLERFCVYARERGTPLSMNFCLMAQNYHEFGDLLLFGEERGIKVNVSVVHYPEECSIARLDPSEIARIHGELLAQSDAVLAGLDRNAGTWRTEVARIGSWLEGYSEKTDHNQLWGLDLLGPLDFRSLGVAPHDDTAARAALTEFAENDTAYTVHIERGEDIADLSEEAAAVVGSTRGELVGQHAQILQRSLAERYGRMSAHEVLAESDDQIDVMTTYGRTEFRTSMVAMRDAAGFAAEARIILAYRSLDGSTEPTAQ